MASLGNKFNVAQRPKASPPGGRYFGIYLGTVMNTADPMQQGRVMVTVPDLGVRVEWAPSCAGSPAPLGGKAVVGFLSGDPDYPVVLGYLP